MIVFDAKKLMEEMRKDYISSRNKEEYLKETLQKLGYKNCPHCGKDTMEKKLGESDFLISIVSYSYTSGVGFSLTYNVGVKSKDDALKYIASKNNNSYYMCGLIAYVFTNAKTIIFETELLWSTNQLQYAWRDKYFEDMIDFLIESDKMFAQKYSSVDNIVNDYQEEIEFTKNIQIKNGKPTKEDSPISITVSALYYLFNDYENAIKSAEETLEHNSKLLDENNYILLQQKAFLDYLKHGTPLPYIPSPADKSSIIEPTDEDVYICLNKKTAKANDILEYFGGANKFSKPSKIEYKDMQNYALSICKVGKWSIIKIDADLIMSLEQDAIENMLEDMSSKYNRSILFVNQDVTNTFGFEIYKKGELIRRWMAGDGEVFENVGKPIVGEKKRFLDTLSDEQGVESVAEFLNDSLLKITYFDLESSKTVGYILK